MWNGYLFPVGQRNAKSLFFFIKEQRSLLWIFFGHIVYILLPAAHGHVLPPGY